MPVFPYMLLVAHKLLMSRVCNQIFMTLYQSGEWSTSEQSGDTGLKYGSLTEGMKMAS